MLRNSAAEHEAHMVRVKASQRRGQWTRLVRRIDELRFRANVNHREPTEAEARDIKNCQIELATVEAAMEAAGQAPR
jgi:hypothetical protein